MRRAFLAVALGGLLLTAGACDTDADSSTAAPTIVTPSSTLASPATDYSANTKQVCDKVAAIFRNDMNSFSAEMGKMIARKEANETAAADEAEKAAAAKLTSAGAKIRKETAAAEDPELKTAGAASAAKLAKSAKDTRFFDSIDTAKDLESKIQAKLTDWMSPVTGFCAA